MAEQEEPLELISLDENLEDIEKPPELANGWYKGEVQSVQVKTSAGKGNRYYAIEIRIPAESIPADVAEHYEDGAQFFWNRQLVPNPAKPDRRLLHNMKLMVKAFGLPTNTTQFDPNEWMGCDVKVQLKQSAYNGENRAQIVALESVDGPTGAKPKAKPAEVETAQPRSGRRR